MKNKATKHSAIRSNTRNNIGNLKNAFKDTLRKKYKDPIFSNLPHSADSLCVWRVNKLKLEAIDVSEYGLFYDGDSYLVLSIREGDKGELLYDIYIWIGKYSSIDEYTTVALKSAELDNNILNGCATQHREVQDNETETFLNLFPKFSIVKGGHDSASSSQPKNDDSSDTIPTRLFHISGIGKAVKMVEVSYRYENLNSDDVFILQIGKKIYQLNGKNSNSAEKMWAIRRIQAMKDSNPKIVSEVIDESDTGFDHPIIKEIPRKNKATIRKNRGIQKTFVAGLYRLSDASGSMEFKFVKNRPFKKSDLDTKDAFIIDNGDICYIWIGKKSSDDEKCLAIVYGNMYLKDNNRNEVPLQTVHQGKENKQFWDDLLKKV